MYIKLTENTKFRMVLIQILRVHSKKPESVLLIVVSIVQIYFLLLDYYFNVPI